MVGGGDTPPCAPALTGRRSQRRRHPLPASPRHAGGWCGRHGATRQRHNGDQRGRGHAYLPGLACVLPQVDALYTRKVARGAGGLPLYVGMGECIPRDREEGGGHLHESDAGGMLRGWGSHEHTRVVGDAADPHQHARDRLPEALQDGVCKARAPLDRSREAHARGSAALRSLPDTASGSQWRGMGVPSTRLARRTILWTAVVRCERRVDGLKQGGVAKRFGEEGHRARLQRLGAQGCGPIRRQKNQRELGLARA